MLQLIEIDKLVQHPDNPRKDLGDLIELADSIKANGILQNLTVVPYIGEVTGEPIEGLYRVVIGHRRLAAAKLAGLKEVPCIISKMSPADQVATMLLENMQRNDLTVYEQAQGFQMLLNFGDSVGMVSLRTGFSENTVRRRIKLLELDQEKFKSSVQRGATLFDYAQLEMVENLDLRNKVLDEIGTPNFKWKLQQAIEKEKNDKVIAIMLTQISAFATEIEDSNGLRYITAYYPSQYKDKEIEMPVDADAVQYYYLASEYNYITLYSNTKEALEIDTVTKEKESQRKARHNALEKISKRAVEFRRDFIRNISNEKAKKNMGFIVENMVSALLGNYVRLLHDDFADLMGVDLDKGDMLEVKNIVEDLRKQPDRYMLIATYCLLDGEERRRYYSPYDCTYLENGYLDRVYYFIEGLGYEISDEERQLQDGTHELFITSED